MHKRYFIKLVRKHIKGNATPEEEQLLFSYYNLFEFEPDVIELLNDERQQIKDHISENIKQGIELRARTKTARILKIGYISAAAAVIAGFLITYTIFLHQPQKQQQKQIAKVITIKKNENRLIHLPDGSVAIVMKGSKLTFPASFDGLKKREVYLEGEAYFDIKHNAGQAFIVHTGKLQTTVLGTAFNVKALKTDKFIVVTVTRGKVSVGDKNKVYGTITPNQQIVFNKSKANSQMKQVDAAEFACWQGQDLMLDDVTMEEASKLLKERFKVEIQCVDPKLQINRFTTEFQYSESLEHVLKILAQYNNTTYSYDKENNIVTIGNKQIN
jgi:ferric-dicitrate binding protein FerR (iron transport regulator)